MRARLELCPKKGYCSGAENHWHLVCTLGKTEVWSPAPITGKGVLAMAVEQLRNQKKFPLAEINSVDWKDLWRNRPPQAKSLETSR